MIHSKFCPKASAAFALLALTLSLTAAFAQTTPNTTASAQVPRLIKFAGIAKDESGKPLSGTVGITFSFYNDESGGAPLWMETQNIQADSTGHYTALIGSATADGVPLSLFSSVEAQWLGIKVENQPEQPRVLLVSVPYALKAHEAETLSGKSISDFVLAQPGGSPSANAVTGAIESQPVTGQSVHSAASTATKSFSGTNSTEIVSVTQKGTGSGLTATTSSTTTNAAGVNGFASATTGQVYGVNGSTSSTTTFAAGVNGWEGATTGYVFGVSGATPSTTNYSAGVIGTAAGTTGTVYGTVGVSNSTTNGAAGVNGYEPATTGQVYGVAGGTSSTTNGASGVNGYEGASSGAVYGVSGGTSSPTSGAAGVSGSETATTGQVYGVYGQTSSSTLNAAGVYGFAAATTGQVNGVAGSTNSTSGSGVNGYSGATSGYSNGVSGESNSPNGVGVQGVNNSSSGGNGVAGYSNATSGQFYGVFGETNSSTLNAAGVYGYAATATGQAYGVAGSTNSTSGGGVNGYSGATSGYTNGVSGESNSPNGAGVQGTNNSSSGGNGVAGVSNATSGFAYGVYGQSASTGGAGVNGTATATSGNTDGVYGSSASTSGIGVFGDSGATSGGTGVQGQTESASGGSAGTFVAHGGGGLILNGLTGSSFVQVFSVDSSGDGYFAGNLNVTGTLTKGSGSFKIDHPLDPANKYLSHSFVESPDMMNVYNGNITTDRRGLATVKLPDYFGALNRDYRYQLTVVGQFAQAIVARKIANNRFVIRTNKPDVEVSWQVTGIRQDAYANTNRIPVEEDKPATEQGYYLHPEAFGQPQSKSIASAQKTTRVQDVLAQASPH